MVSKISSKGEEEELLVQPHDLSISEHNLLSIEDLTFMSLLKSREAFFAYMALAIAMFNQTFFAGFLSLQLETYGIDESEMGYYIAIMSIAYFIAALSCPYILANVPRKLQFVGSMLISSIALAFMGPS